jgi:pimeloyl-ACP methyl ester carboxylesterase
MEHPLTRSAPAVRELKSLSAHGFHRVVYYQWGGDENPNVVICVHGVGRNGRDFDVLGEALSANFRVLAPDMPGRGQSEWLFDPMDYAFPTYLTTLTALIAAARVERVSWVGTSMGGLLGIVMAAQRNTPIARLVVNDVGPTVEPAAVARIAEYFGKDVSFGSYPEIEAYVRQISAPFGPLTDVQWAHMTRTNVRQRSDGRWVIGYDPAIAVPFKTSAVPPSLWPVWDAIACPTLLLHGAQSDLLTQATADEMSKRGPRPKVLDFAGVGHAPMLLTDDQISPVARFLRDGSIT